MSAVVLAAPPDVSEDELAAIEQDQQATARERRLVHEIRSLRRDLESAGVALVETLVMVDTFIRRTRPAGPPGAPPLADFDS